MASASRKRRKRSRSAPRPRPADDGAAKPPAAAKRRAGAAATRSRRQRSADDRPPAPWGSFPLVELVVLAALVLLVAGFIAGGEQGSVMIVTGLVLGSLGGLELTIREHFAGYRSHTLVLSAFPAVVVLGVLFYLAPTGLGPVARVAIGLAVFGACAWLLARAFRRRSGRAFKLR